MFCPIFGNTQLSNCCLFGVVSGCLNIGHPEVLWLTQSNCQLSMSHFETNSCFSAGDVAKALMASFQGSHAVLIFLRRRKFPLSYPCYHPQYVSTIFKISPLLVDKSYVTSLGFSENSAPPDLNRFSRHSLLKLLWDVVGIPSFFPRWIRRAQFCWSSARRK